MQGEALIDQPAAAEPVAPTGADRAREALRARREAVPEFLARGGRLVGGERIMGVQASTEPGGELRFVPVVDASSVVPDEEDSPSNCRSCGEALDDGQSFLCGACALAGSWTPDQDRPAHGTGWQDPATVAAASDLVRATLNGIGLGDHECEPAPDQVYFCRHCGADLMVADPQAAEDRAMDAADAFVRHGAAEFSMPPPEEWITVPWRTPLGPDEPIRITLPGVYDLTAEQYHDVKVTGDWLSNSDVKKILQTCPAQFQYDRWNGVRKTSDAFDFGHVWHARVLGKGEAYRVFEPKKLDGRTKEGKAQRAEVDAARAAGITPIYGDQFALIEAMAQAVEVDPVALGLMSAPGRQEVCLFWTETIKVTNPQNSLYGQMVTVKRRAMIDHLPDMPDDPNATVTLVDGKTADEVKPDDNMRKKIYDYGYHRQADTYAAGVEALFGRAAEVVFLFQSKKPPHLIVPVDLDTPAMLVAAAENRQVMEVWAECVETGVWPGYTKGIATSGVPAWIERQYEDEMVIG